MRSHIVLDNLWSLKITKIIQLYLIMRKLKENVILINLFLWFVIET